jgi:TRAP-type C4-dicarboxylate transport system substrate-binding protein
VKKALLILALLATPALAAPKVVLRMATVAPDGTAWARELKAFAREVGEATGGEVGVKMYFGGIAGDDLQTYDRIKRDQLDGAGSGMLCEKLAPSMRVLRIPGLYRSREELRAVAGKLRPTFEEEFSKKGLAFMGHAILGQLVVSSKQPVRNLADLKRTPLWSWDIDEVANLAYEAMGLNLYKAPVDNASQLYSDVKIEGFLALPTALLAWQWSAQAHYLIDVKASYFMSCLMITDKAMSRMQLPHQQIIRSAVAKLAGRLESLGAEQDEKLMGGLFGRQGLSVVPVGDSFRKEFQDAARAASARLGDRLVPASLLKRVNDILTEYRAQHPVQAAR